MEVSIYLSIDDEVWNDRTAFMVASVPVSHAEWSIFLREMHIAFIYEHGVFHLTTMGICMVVDCSTPLADLVDWLDCLVISITGSPPDAPDAPDEQLVLCKDGRHGTLQHIAQCNCCGALVLSCILSTQPPFRPGMMPTDLISCHCFAGNSKIDSARLDSALDAVRAAQL